jgi:hypothetical protein
MIVVGGVDAAQHGQVAAIPQHDAVNTWASALRPSAFASAWRRLGQVRRLKS